MTCGDPDCCDTPLIVRVHYDVNVTDACGDPDCCGTPIEKWVVAINGARGYGDTIREAFTDAKSQVCEPLHACATHGRCWTHD